MDLAQLAELVDPAHTTVLTMEMERGVVGGGVEDLRGGGRGGVGRRRLAAVREELGEEPPGQIVHELLETTAIGTAATAAHPSGGPREVTAQPAARES